MKRGGYFLNREPDKLCHRGKREISSHSGRTSKMRGESKRTIEPICSTVILHNSKGYATGHPTGAIPALQFQCLEFVFSASEPGIRDKLYAANKP